MKRQMRAIAMAMALATGFTGCEQIRDKVDGHFWHRQAVKSTSEPEVASSPSSSSQIAERKALGEVLKEMIEIIEVQIPKDRSVFGSWLNTLNQGGSLEGIYNSLTHSDRYRALELSVPGPFPRVAEVFKTEFRDLRSAMKNPRALDASMPLPLPTGQNQALMQEPVVEVVTFGKPRTVTDQIFDHSSPFTLKRLLGEQALELLEQKGIAGPAKDRGELAEWYGNWVVRVAKYGVDFGLPLRNQADAAFHRDWAKEAAPDRLRWEVLNRIHRLLNRYFIDEMRSRLPSKNPAPQKS